MPVWNFKFHAFWTNPKKNTTLPSGNLQPVERKLSELPVPIFFCNDSPYTSITFLPVGDPNEIGVGQKDKWPALHVLDCFRVLVQIAGEANTIKWKRAGDRSDPRRSNHFVYVLSLVSQTNHGGLLEILGKSWKVCKSVQILGACHPRTNLGKPWTSIRNHVNPWNQKPYAEQQETWEHHKQL